MPSIARTGQIRVVPNGSQREGEYAAVRKYSKIPEVAQPPGISFFRRRRQFVASRAPIRDAARVWPSTVSFCTHGCSAVPGFGGGGGGGGGGTPR